MFDDIIDGKSFDTYIYGAKTKSVDQLQIVCLFPENLDIMLLNVPEDKRSDKVGELGGWCKRWVAGTQTPLEELRHHNKIPWFRALGWQCGKLEIGDATGFRAIRG